jgi:bifunctional DNA-binding transcriptional regulator/antitoxin component of YhaV-PrlF toxin-antitoxin module
MPQLVKGGKHTYGWSCVGDTGRIILPPEAIEYYHLKESERLLLVPGSQTSGGFGLAPHDLSVRSPLGNVMDAHPELKEFRVPEGEVIVNRGKAFCWVELRDSSVEIPPRTLKHYGIRIGDILLVIRGSGLAIGFALWGPIVEEALKHDELEVFKPES